MKIKIKFTDFHNKFVPEKSSIYKMLNRYYDIEMSNNPDYLFYSCFGYDFLKYDCIRIFLSGENIIPDFNLCDYAMASYHMEFGDRYLRSPNYIGRKEVYTLAINKHELYKDINLTDRKFCNFVYSNGWAHPARKEIFELILAYKKVDSGGRYLNNIGYRIDNKLEFQKMYKFSLAIENDTSIGYTTEKIIDAFAAGSIPIYWGDPAVGDVFNEKSFINCHLYDSFEEVLNKVIDIDQDDNAYLEMIKQPIYKNSSLAKQYSEESIIKFLRHIFDQDLEQARRRCKYYFAQRYEQDMRKLIKYSLYDLRNKHGKISRKIMKRLTGTYQKY